MQRFLAVAKPIAVAVGFVGDGLGRKSLHGGGSALNRLQRQLPQGGAIADLTKNEADAQCPDAVVTLLQNRAVEVVTEGIGVTEVQIETGAGA